MADARLEGFLDAMREGGLRITTARRIIARNLLAMDGHVTGQRLAARVRAEAPEIDDSTVYRFLEAASELGLTVHRQLDVGPAVHHLADDAHVHLICSGCGTLQEVPESAFRTLTTQFTERYGFTIRPNHFAVEGWCASCLAGDPGSRLPHAR